MLHLSARRAAALAASRVAGAVLKPRLLPLTVRPASSATKRVADIAAAGASDDGATVTVQGWVRSVRQQKAVSFLTLNDGSTAHNLQVVWEGKSGAVAVQGAGGAPAAVTTGCSVRITGKLVPSPKPAQPFEVHASAIEVVGGADSQSFPLQKKAHSLEYLRDIMHLRPRTSVAGAMLRVRHSLTQAVHAYFDGKGYFAVNTPVLTSNDCEGAGELFAVAPASAVSAPSAPAAPAAAGAPAAPPAAPAPPAHFFSKPVYLTVSGQLHLEAFACALSRVYTFGPTFRAENSNTTRHLAEFWMLEPELAPGTAEDAMDLAEGCVKACVTGVLEKRGSDLATLVDRVDSGLMERLQRTASGAPFPRIRYTEAVNILQASGQAFKQPVVWGEGLASEHERWLAESHVGGPLFVTDYPAAIKPFYMRHNEPRADEPSPTVGAFDLLVPRIGELIGGSAREERAEVLGPAMAAAGLLSPRMAAAARKGPQALAAEPPADPNAGLDWYLDLRRFGSVPHAGWGMGFERLVLFCTGLENIRDAIPMPRVPGSCRM